MARSPKRPTRKPRTSLQSLPGAAEPISRNGPVGTFQDLQALFDQLGEPPLIELGTPLPGERYLLKVRVGSCPAAHNRALLGE